MKRYGRSRRHAQRHQRLLRIFVRYPKKTFATISWVERTSHLSGATSGFGPGAEVAGQDDPNLWHGHKPTNSGVVQKCKVPRRQLGRLSHRPEDSVREDSLVA